jgi:hypothetical protein
VVPEYAILSHTWEKKELSFQDMREHGVTGETHPNQNFLRAGILFDS